MEIRLVQTAEPGVISGGIELLDVWQARPDTLVWVNVAGLLTDADSRQLHERFGLHPLALQDAARDRHPPKFERFDDHSFLLFKGLSADSDSIDCATIQLAIFVGERFLVTRHSGESTSIERLACEIDDGKFSASRGTGAMAARLCRFIVRRYLRVLLALEPRLEELEQTVLTGGDDAVLAELIGYKADLTRLRRFLHYHVDLLADLRHAGNSGFGEDLHHEVVDVYEQQERAASLADLFCQQSADLIDGYISVSSHQLNQIMRVLTIITAIFVPCRGLFARGGIYTSPGIAWRGGRDRHPAGRSQLAARSDRSRASPAVARQGGLPGAKRKRPRPGRGRPFADGVTPADRTRCARIRTPPGGTGAADRPAG